MNEFHQLKLIKDQLDRIEEKIDNRLLTINQVADRYQVNSSTVYRWIKQGELRSTKIGGSLYVKQTDLK